MNFSKIGSLKNLRYNYETSLCYVYSYVLDWGLEKLILLLCFFLCCIYYKNISKEQRERRAKNIYNHRMSKKCYAGLAEELVGLIMRSFLCYYQLIRVEYSFYAYLVMIERGVGTGISR